jgi:hypothetical protein
MDADRLLSIGLGLGGFVVAVYTTSEFAGLFFGTDWMPVSVLRLGQLDRVPATVNRFGRAIVDVLLFAAVQFVALLALTAHRQEFDALDQALFLGELVATAGWIGWLVRLRARGRNVAT